MTPEPSSVPFSWTARGRSFLFAARGLRVLVATQHNSRLHLAATVAVLIAGAVAHLTPLEWVAIVAAIGFVWVAEALNTALERLADAITKEIRPEIRDAKDVGAGAVLAAAATSFAIGLVIFLPRLIGLLQGAVGSSAAT